MSFHCNSCRFLGDLGLRPNQPADGGRKSLAVLTKKTGPTGGPEEESRIFEQAEKRRPMSTTPSLSRPGRLAGAVNVTGDEALPTPLLRSGGFARVLR